MLREEGLRPGVRAPPAACRGDAPRGARWGLEVLCRNPAEYSGSLTAVMMPEGHDADAFRRDRARALRHVARHGPRQARRRVFRIGHLGFFNDLMLCGTLCGVEMGLALRDVPHRKSGVRRRWTVSPRPGVAVHRREPPAAEVQRAAIGNDATTRVGRESDSQPQGGSGMNKFVEDSGALAIALASAPAHRVGAHQARRDRGGRRRRRRVRPDGAHDAGGDPEEQSDEAADGRVAQGRRVRRRSADVHEVERRRPQQGPHRLFADLHAAARGQDPVQLARPDPGLGHRDGPVRAVGQHDAAVQER